MQNLEGDKAITMMQIQLATVLFEACYQLVLALYAIRTRNIVTAVGVCINNFSMPIFVILAGLGIDRVLVTMNSILSFQLASESLTAEERHDNEIQMVSPNVFRRGFGGLIGTIVLCTFAMGFVTYKLYGQFAWYAVIQTLVFYD